jgi:GWxTD domain-containing protein
MHGGARTTGLESIFAEIRNRMCKAGLCLLLLLISLRGQALDATMSHTLFYRSDPSQNGKLAPSIETYWQINPRTVHFVTNADKMIVAHIKTDIVLIGDAGVVKEDHFVLNTVPCATVEDLMQHSIIDLRRYFVGAGHFTIKLSIKDMADTTNKYACTDSFTVTLPVNVAYFSGVQLLDTVLDSKAQTRFYKNEKQQLPLCTNFLDDSKKVLHYYAELYGTDAVSKIDYPLIQKVTIGKKANEAHYSDFIKTDTIAPDQALPLSGSFEINTLPSGNYYLNVALENKEHRVIANGTLFFQRLNVHPAEEKAATANIAKTDTSMEKVNMLNLDKTFLAKYTLAEVKAILKMLLPVADPMETQTIQGFLKKPDDLYMRYFVYNYFLNINKKDPGRAWKEYSEKVIEVNKLYKGHGSRGYETDRGFVYLRYGPPTDVITVENETGTLPYEIWQYNTLRDMTHKDVAEAVFLFYKTNDMIGDFKLLHSNVTGELQNKGWRNYLYVNSQGGNNTNSRAEQYIGTK